MAIRTVGLWMAAGAALVACTHGESAATPDAGRPSGPASPSPGPTAAPAPTGGMAPAPAHPDAGAAAASLLPFAVTLQNSGRHGDALLLNVQGNDPAAQTTEAQVQLLDAMMAPVMAFDTNWDGVPDASSTRIHFDQSTLGQKSFQTTITLAGLYGAAPSTAFAVVSLSDANGNLSAPVTAALRPQPVQPQGSSCDTLAVANRCDEGLWCTGMPATCQTAAVPSLTQVAYFGGSSPAQLFAGTDQAEDLASLQVDFLDTNGKSLIVDLSSDGTATPSASVLLDAQGALGQAFFFENDPSTTFAGAVPKISVTPTDSFGNSGKPVVATLATQPVIASGMSCDPRGFVACATGTACSPGVFGITNHCAALSSLQTDKCNAAPPPATSGALAGWGAVSGVSLWDPPVGCSTATAVNHPESIVMLKLAQATTTLTISTAMPETNFDTVLYVLPGCATSSASALACNDDTQGYTSTVTLMNVAAGTYAIVVDSATSHVGTFGLSIQSQ
jgi:hypothetical protein